MKALDKIFINNKLFKAAIILAGICFLIDAAIVLIVNPAINIFNSTMAIGLCICNLLLLYFSQKYKDNLVKGIAGLLLGLIFAYDLRFFDKNYMWFTSLYLFFGILKLILDVALIVFYFVAREDPDGQANAIRYCQGTFVVLALITILNNVPYFVDDFMESNPCWFIQDIVETLAFILSYFAIVSVACTVDKYKALRAQYEEKNEWTQERRIKTKEELFGK